MKILGIIAEYNPFHNGHKYHLEKSKELTNADATVAVMSGNFVQRGLPACFDKWTRAKNAIKSGVDLVVELPVDFAMSSAERFAFGGVYLLNQIGADYIAFGAESSEEQLLKTANRLINPNENYKADLKTYLNQGLSFPAARQKALGNDSVLSSPNNILAIEYLKALSILSGKTQPVILKRFKAGYHDILPTDNIASATAVRKMMENNEDVSNLVPYDISKNAVTISSFEKAIICSIISKTPKELAEFCEVREGLENRIYKAAFESSTFDELVTNIKTKRYTYSSVSRMIFNIFLGITNNKFATHPQYIRVLASNSKGRAILNSIESQLPVITKPSEVYNYDLPEAELDFTASDIYFACANMQKKGRVDLTTSPIILP